MRPLASSCLQGQPSSVRTNRELVAHMPHSQRVILQSGLSHSGQPNLLRRDLYLHLFLNTSIPPRRSHFPGYYIAVFAILIIRFNRNDARTYFLLGRQTKAETLEARVSRRGGNRQDLRRASQGSSLQRAYPDEAKAKDSEIEARTSLSLNLG